MRFTDWPERHAAFIETRRFMPFAWGSNDCALFAADHTLAITGRDFAEGLRTYDSEAGAAELIAKAGGMAGFARELVAKPRGLARRGDIVLAMCEGRQTFGIALVDGHWCAPGADGLVFRLMTDVITAFEV